MAMKRIEYIDAMRGFTMILVVYSHVCQYCLGDKCMGWNDVFFLFRLPCFFFISGCLFEPVREPIRTVAKKKFMVQIIPTVIFLLILAPPPLFFSRLGATKGGYWFTFALFVFFLLYLFWECYLKRWGCVFALAISIAAFCYDVNYNCYFKDMGLLTQTLGFLSFVTWRYYIFFFIGTRVKRHFDKFTRWIGKPAVYIAVVVGFALFAWYPRSENTIFAYLIFSVGGFFGLTMVFSFFCLFAHYFTKEGWGGRSLQYVGTRTLDIYLLHYFLLPRFLIKYRDSLVAYDSQFLDFMVAMTLSMIVVAGCILVSYAIRLSPFLGHYLFGVKYERKQ